MSRATKQAVAGPGGAVGLAVALALVLGLVGGVSIIGMS